MKKAKTIKSVFAWLGIILGIGIILLGFKVKDSDVGDTPDTAKFGADFYTEMYGVTREVAKNVRYGNEALVEGIGWFLIAFGAADICLFFRGIFSAMF